MIVRLCIALFGALFFCNASATVHSEWQYSRASDYAQHEQWPEAQQGMQTLLIDDPDNTDLLYDSGVVAYRMKEFEKAEAYFNRATQCDEACVSLKKRAHFNVGNTRVALNKLPEAIESYQAVLAIDPDDERAKHNMEQVKKLLQQQEEQKEQQQNQKQDQKQDKQQKDQGGEQQDQKENDQNNQQQNNTTDQDKKRDTSSKDQQQKGDNGDPQDSEKNQSGGKQKEKEESDQQENGEEKDKSNDDSDNNQREQEQEQLRDHNASPQERSEQKKNQQSHDSGFQNTKEEQKEQAMQGEARDDELQDLQEKQQEELAKKLGPHEQWMSHVLQQREQADEKANKRVVKATIDKQLAGRHGQNCW